MSLAMDRETLLASIEAYGKLYFSIKDMALGLGEDVETFRATYEADEELRRAYAKGMISSKAEWTESVRKLAIAGSSPAQVMFKGIMDKSLLNE